MGREGRLKRGKVDVWDGWRGGGLGGAETPSGDCVSFGFPSVELVFAFFEVCLPFA